jgi:2-C-methyl-D-erythritol 4-phosphate cytidylyltransferase
MRVTSPSARFFALIPCAGSGSRAGTAKPKQYEVIAGRPMVAHTLAAFAGVPRLSGTLVVVAPGDDFLSPDATFSIAACGGSMRAITVLNGLCELKSRGAADTDWALVHDAARCLITPAMIERLIDACASDEVGGLLAQPLADTLKSAHDGRVAETLPRDGKWLAQTPQMFRIGPLTQALREAGAGATDEASAMEALGLKPLLVPGSAQNFKVTYPDDFALAEAVLRSRQT